MSNPGDTTREPGVINDQDVLDAEAEVLRDPDLLGDWLASELIDEPAVDLGYVPGAFAGHRVAFEERLRGWTTAQLVVLALNRSDWAGQALAIVRERYTAESQAQISQRAARIARAMEEA